MFIKVFQSIFSKVPFPCSSEDIELSLSILLNVNSIEFISVVNLDDGLILFHFHTQARVYYFIGALYELEHVNL